MQNIEKFVSTMASYDGFILFGIFTSLLIIAVIIIKVILRKAGQIAKDRQKINKENLKNINMRKIPESRHGEILRTAIAADGIDPNPLSYMIIMDGGHEKYVRTYTLIGKPKRTVFAKTFTDLFNFAGCTSSAFIEPLSEEEMGRKLDKHITVLSSEHNMAAGDPNRRRKLSNQAREANAWAEEIENGENKFFRVGFLFSLYADSLSELNKQSDSFYYEALAKGIRVSACYGMQAEAYALNGPFNCETTAKSKTVTGSPIKFITMDKYSVSTLFNYLQASFSDKSGIPIGRDLNTGNPIYFDLYGEHDSMSLAIAGKPGSGKSSLIKVMAARQSLFDWHYVAIDSQQKKGTSEGEYAALAIAVGGVNIQIRNAADGDIMNLFDLSETVLSVKVSDDLYKETMTVDLAGKVITLTNCLISMILASHDGRFDSMNEQTYVKSIITDTVIQTYHDFNIYDGDAESLYETVEGLKRRKRLPTICDFYQRILRNNRNNKDEALAKAYTLIIYGLKESIRELYYTKESIKFLTRAEFDRLESDENGTKIYHLGNGRTEDVIAVRGVRAYYDGQSTININRDCPFVNIDISMLKDDEKKLARQIAIAWVNENFIKKNSERLDSNSKLVVILDEAHECFKDAFALDTVDITVREARKRHVGIILATQTIREYERNPVTKDLLGLIECKFIFKQDYQDRAHLMETLGVTSSQADMIVSGIGGSDTGADQKRHRGEMCMIDGKKVSFCKVDLLERTEGLLSDTNAATVVARLKKAV